VRLKNGETGGYSSFPLVNHLPVAPVHEPECQLVNHVALVHKLSPTSEGDKARSEAKSEAGTGE
jgi:hypothetical protein